MSIHSSLRTDKHAAGSLRNVLKRHERVRRLMEQGLWTEGRSVFGLPKVKQVKMKVRKAAKEKEEASATPAAAGAAPAAS
jgi:small basic protein (TIGR04137 family)